MKLPNSIRRLLGMGEDFTQYITPVRNPDYPRRWLWLYKLTPAGRRKIAEADAMFAEDRAEARAHINRSKKLPPLFGKDGK
jgi:DNA-binding MarR family transcriptional regulator